MTTSQKHRHILILMAVVLCSSLAFSAKLKTGDLYIQVIDEQEDEVEKKNYKTNVNSRIKSEELKLTQSSRIKI